MTSAATCHQTVSGVQKYQLGFPFLEGRCRDHLSRAAHIDKAAANSCRHLCQHRIPSEANDREPRSFTLLEKTSKRESLRNFRTQGQTQPPSLGAREAPASMRRYTSPSQTQLQKCRQACFCQWPAGPHASGLFYSGAL